MLDRSGLAVVKDSSKVLFMYPGQGSQRQGDLSALAVVDAEFRTQIEALEASFPDSPLRSYLSGSWSKPPSTDPLESRLNSTAVAQPMLFTLAVAVTEALKRLGVLPDVTIGHSVGEVGALVGAGHLETEFAAELIRRRVKSMRENQGQRSGMIAVRAPAEKVTACISNLPTASIAGDNSPNQVTVGASLEELLVLESVLTGQGLPFARLRTAAAFHTNYLSAADRAFRASISDLEWPTSGSKNAICFSTVSGKRVESIEQAADLLSKQLAQPVRFRQAALSASAAGEPALLVQVSGGDSLLKLYRETNPQFMGRSVRMGGAFDTAGSLAAGLGEMFLTVKGFLPQKILATERAIATGSNAFWSESTSVVLGRERLPETSVDAEPEPKGEVEAGVHTPGGLLSRAFPQNSLLGEMVSLFQAQVAVLSNSSWGESELGVNEQPRQRPNVRVVTARGKTDREHTSRAEIAVWVSKAVAEAGGYSATEISEEMGLRSDLGLDSLMVTGAIARIAQQFPDIPLDAEGITDKSTVRDLIETVYGGVGPGRIDGSTLDLQQPVRRTEDSPKIVTQDLTRLHEAPDVLETTARIIEAQSRGEVPPYYLPHNSVASATTVLEGEKLLSFSSYNYLGLAGNKKVKEAVKRAVEHYGTSSSAARILSGSRPIHEELEEGISRLLGVEDSVALVGGHSTNASIVPHLYGHGDLVLHDALIHDSILQGIKASGASRHAFGHNNIDMLEQALSSRRNKFRRVLVITEGIFSMDGDVAELKRLIVASKQFNAHLMLDEAHSVGVLGARGGGLCEELGVDPNDVDILMGTLSKSLASCGGYIAGRKSFIDHLRYSLSSLVFSAAMTPANAAASVAALKEISSRPEILQDLRRNAAYFLDGAKARGLNTGQAIGVPIVPVIVGDSLSTMRLAARLKARSISANPIVFPAVAESLSRIRFFVTSEHTERQMDEALDATAEVMSELEGLTSMSGGEQE